MEIDSMEQFGIGELGFIKPKIQQKNFADYGPDDWRHTT